MLQQRSPDCKGAAMPKLSHVKYQERSTQVVHKKMVAFRDAKPLPFCSDIPALVTPLKVDDVSSTHEECSSPHQEETGRIEVQQIRESYSEVSIEVTQSDGDLSEDGLQFRNSLTIGKQLQATGNYSQALHFYRTALQCKNKTIDSEPQSVQEAFADILYDIGNIHLVRGFENRAKSMEAFHFCLEIRRACFGSSHPAVASVLYKLASIHSSFADNEYALDLLLEAVSILLCDSHEGNNCGLIEVWSAIGKVQEALGEREEARSSFQEAEQLK
jgi:tetratricopeptide (TPR) repeat protein